MRYHRLRFDIWLCLLLSVGVSLLPANLIRHFMSQNYGSYVEEHTVAEGEIGGKAGKDVFRAESIEDLKTHDTFTVISPGIEYRNRGSGYYGNQYLQALTLPSGERVAAAINMENVQVEGDYYTGEATLPLGKIVWEDLTENESFINQIEYTEPLSRTDFYVDMMGNGGKLSQEDYTEPAVMLAQILTVVIFFPMFHALGSKLGIFRHFLPGKRRMCPNGINFACGIL